MLVRFDPLRELDRLSRDPWGTSRQPWMSMDAYRQDDHVVVQFDLPGIDPASVEVTVEKGTLTVQAERSRESAEGRRVLVSERAQGRFTRRLRLGTALDGAGTEARYDNGVLTLTVPVAETAKPRKVQISLGGQPAAEVAEVPAVDSAETASESAAA
jgi:HSP20 family protein